MDRMDSLLSQYNFRMTPQRKAILQVLFQCRGHHLEIENIYELLAAKNKNMKVGLATVYRNLEMFKRLGLVSRLSMENSPARYELILHDTHKHHHLICLHCGQVEEIEDKAAETFARRVLIEKSFQIADKPMKIYGYCKRCKSIIRQDGKKPNQPVQAN